MGLIAGLGTGAAAAAVGLVWLWIARTYTVVTVRGLSMAPTLLPGDRLLVRRRGARWAHHGDVVVIAPPTADLGRAAGGWVVKRVAAVAGEPVPEGALPATAPDLVVPDGRLVLLGDGPCSVDSRQLGFFSNDDLLGVVLRRLG
jgi:signal peptidase I